MTASTTTAAVSNVTVPDQSTEGKNVSENVQNIPPPFEPPNTVSTETTVASKETSPASSTSPDVTSPDANSDVSVAAIPQDIEKQPPPGMKRYNSFSTAMSGQNRYSSLESAPAKGDVQIPERYEGQLHRKHEMESSTKKASNR